MKLNTLKMHPALTALVIVTTIIGKLTAAPVTVPDFSLKKLLLPMASQRRAECRNELVRSGNTARFCGGVYLMNQRTKSLRVHRRFESAPAPRTAPIAFS